MLNAEILRTLKLSAPALAEHGETITRRFYQILFERNPELKHLFNLSNQISGNQAKALAQTLFAYAHLAEQPQQLGPLIRRIAHKHASLSVQPHQYPLVGDALLAAMAECLDCSMQDPLILAWGQAYQSLSQVFIDQEQALYKEQTPETGKWRDFKHFTITGVRAETAEITSFYLEPTDKSPLPQFQPGQYVGVKLDLPDHPYQEIRQYSLSDAPGLGHYRITVKAETGTPPGRVSQYLHHQAKVGHHLWLSAPYGDFALPETWPSSVVLISGGVGITPMMSMLKAMLSSSDTPDITFIHCTQNAQHQAFFEELNDLHSKGQFHYYRAYVDEDNGERGAGDHTGFLNQDALQRFLPKQDSEYYFCGPYAFMQFLEGQLLSRGIAKERLHYEVFGPTLELTQSDAA